MKNIKKIIKNIPFAKSIYYKLSVIRIPSLFFLFDYLKFKRNNDSRFILSLKNLHPQTKDKTTSTKFDLHYIYHPAWAARVINKTKPEKHVDISSSLHFSTILSAFFPVDFYDFRPADISLSSLSSKHADLQQLPFEDNSIKSLSCMHTIEHIGLGRYGDAIDPEGDIKAINELKRVLAKDGDLLFVVPLGKPKIYFNAHRVYSYDQVISYFQDLKLKKFSFISELQNKIIINASPKLVSQEVYGCGCFWFKR